MRPLSLAMACHHLTIGTVQPGLAQSRETGPYCSFHGSMLREVAVTCRLCPSHDASPKSDK